MWVTRHKHLIRNNKQWHSRLLTRKNTDDREGDRNRHRHRKRKRKIEKERERVRKQ